MKARLLLAALVFLSQPLLAATEVLQLNYRSADEMLPVVRSTLGDEGKVSAYGNQLIINASPQKIAETRELLGQLDTRPRRLLISVDTSDSASRDERGYRVDGSVSAGGVEVHSGHGGENQVRIIRRSTDSRNGGTQQVQASEGYPALIQVGQSVPLTSRGVGAHGHYYSNTEYRDVTQGFYVTARLNGDQVQLQVDSHNDRLDPSRQGSIDIQRTSTRLSGRLGEWLELGGTRQDNTRDNEGLLRRHATSGARDMSLRIKVEALD